MSSEDSGVWGEQQLYSSGSFEQKGSNLERSRSLVDEMLLGLINSDESNEQYRSKRILSDAHQSLGPTKKFAETDSDSGLSMTSSPLDLHYLTSPSPASSIESPSPALMSPGSSHRMSIDSTESRQSSTTSQSDCSFTTDDIIFGKPLAPALPNSNPIKREFGFESVQNVAFAQCQSVVPFGQENVGYYQSFDNYGQGPESFNMCGGNAYKQSELIVMPLSNRSHSVKENFCQESCDCMPQPYPIGCPDSACLGQSYQDNIYKTKRKLEPDDSDWLNARDAGNLLFSKQENAAKSRAAIEASKRKRIYNKPDKNEALICPECSEVLGIEVVHKGKEGDKKELAVVAVPRAPAVTFEWKFSELKEKLTRTPIVKDWKTFPSVSNGYEMYNFSDRVIKMVIKYTKQADGFADITNRDHETLIQSGWSEIICLYSISCASQNAMFYNIKDGNQKVKAFPTIMIKDITENFYQNQQRLIMAFPIKWRWDLKLRALLFAIIYYNPNRVGLQNPDRVWRLQNQFYNYLKHYLASIYGPEDVDTALTVLHQLLYKITDHSFDFRDGLQRKRWAQKYCPLVSEMLTSTERQSGSSDFS